MCRAITCTTCGKTTWAGCGQHVDAVKRTVPASQWCNGHESSSDRDATAERPGLLARLLGR